MPLVLTASLPCSHSAPGSRRWKHDLLSINMEPSPRLSGNYIGLFHTESTQQSQPKETGPAPPPTHTKGLTIMLGMVLNS